MITALDNLIVSTVSFFRYSLFSCVVGQSHRFAFDERNIIYFRSNCRYPLTRFTVHLMLSFFLFFGYFHPFQSFDFIPLFWYLLWSDFFVSSHKPWIEQQYHLMLWNKVYHFTHICSSVVPFTKRKWQHCGNRNIFFYIFFRVNIMQINNASEKKV